MLDVQERLWSGNQDPSRLRPAGGQRLIGKNPSPNTATGTRCRLAQYGWRSTAAPDPPHRLDSFRPGVMVAAWLLAAAAGSPTRHNVGVIVDCAVYEDGCR